ncbi:hypothetical protein GGR51DRAFT_558147 [Nemania sp. FL0031]|nr:hypothetical protein GGR51DRAFT_558147 [Nemania sp. FL0031]
MSPPRHCHRLSLETLGLLLSSLRSYQQAILATSCIAFRQLPTTGPRPRSDPLPHRRNLRPYTSDQEGDLKPTYPEEIVSVRRLRL